jgi:hypothetical protein
MARFAQAINTYQRLRSAHLIALPIMKQQFANSIYARFGAGHLEPLEGSNFDASLTLRMERLPLIGRLVKKNSKRFPATVQYGDIVIGLPLPSNSCRGLYGSHVLEHLSHQELRATLRNCYQTGGILRVALQDLEFLIKRYLENSESTASSESLREAGLGTEKKLHGPPGIMNRLGRSEHLWMWDEKGLSSELTKAGFTDICRCNFGDSKDPMFRLVEYPDRFVNALALRFT